MGKIILAGLMRMTTATDTASALGALTIGRKVYDLYSRGYCNCQGQNRKLTGK